MDCRELVNVLRRERVPDALYDIPGVHDITVQPDAYYVLRPEQDHWTVGLRERSRERVLCRFSTEDEACRYLHARLTERPRPAPGAAQRVAEVLADREEIQRDAWEAFHRAPRENEPPGRDAEPPPP